MKRLIPMDVRARIADTRGRGVYSGYPDYNKCVFIHIPKAAGTSVAKALFGEGSRHIPYFEYERANPSKFKQYFKFTFVRNPWDRLVSTFFFLKAGGLNEIDRRWAEDHLAAYNDFQTFTENWLTEDNIWSWVHFKPQYHFVCDAELNIKVDFVGRVEQIEKDFTYVADKLNKKVEIQHVNKSRHGPYRDHYTDDLWEKVASIYHKDLDVFGYCGE